MPHRNKDGNPCGYIDVIDDNQKRNFYSRFTIIKISERKMNFYNDNPESLPEDTPCVEEIDLKEASMINDCPYSVIDEPFVFYLTVNGNDRYFKAKCQTDADFWIRIIKKLLIVLPMGVSRSNSCAVRSEFEKLRPTFEDDDEERTISLPCANELMKRKCMPRNIKLNEKNEGTRTITHKKGFCSKVGGSLNNWTYRYFILDNNGLYYYKSDKDEDRTHELGSISYNDMIECRQSCGVYVEREHLFEVVTAKRVYYVQVETERDLKEWVRLINSILKGEKQKIKETKV